MTDRATQIAENLAHHFAPGQSLLEIGAGEGHVARALRLAASVDINLVDVVDYNETELVLELYDGSILPFAHESFDYSLLVFVLHHTADPVRVLQEALRVSKCGVLIVENHVEGWLRKRITQAVDSIPHFQNGVPICYHTYAMTEWHRVFRQLPITVQVLDCFSLGFFWQNFVARLDKCPE